VQSQRSRAGSEKSEKRRSGFFGFVRKDKDKDKDRKEDERRESLQPVREQESQVCQGLILESLNPRQGLLPRGPGVDEKKSDWRGKSSSPIATAIFFCQS
jgi:hypothetical protein